MKHTALIAATLAFSLSMTGCSDDHHGDDHAHSANDKNAHSHGNALGMINFS